MRGVLCCGVSEVLVPTADMVHVMTWKTQHVITMFKVKQANGACGWVPLISIWLCIYRCICGRPQRGPWCRRQRHSSRSGPRCHSVRGLAVDGEAHSVRRKKPVHDRIRSGSARGGWRPGTLSHTGSHRIRSQPQGAELGPHSIRNRIAHGPIQRNTCVSKTWWRTRVDPGHPIRVSWLRNPWRICGDLTRRGPSGSVWGWIFRKKDGRIASRGRELRGPCRRNCRCTSTPQVVCMGCRCESNVTDLTGTSCATPWIHLQDWIKTSGP